MLRRLRPLAALPALALLLPVAGAPAKRAGATTLLSRPSGLAVLPSGPVNDAHSSRFALSADGCRTAFSSSGDGLSSGDDDTVENVYVRDTCAGTTTLVSRATGAAGAGANAGSTDPAISRDGTAVAFVSTATNLAAAGATSGLAHVYVRRLDAGTTTLVDVPADGDGEAGGFPANPVLDGDGDTVAFESRATDLVAGSGPSQNQVFVRTLAGTPHTVLASRADGVSGAAGTQDSGQPSLDASGHLVAFHSPAANLADGDTNGVHDVFVRDLEASSTALVSREGTSGPVGNSTSVGPALSGDGTRIAFQTSAGNLFGTDANSRPDIVVRTLATGVNELASRATGATGAQTTYDATEPVLDQTGARVAFIGETPNLVPGATVILSRIVLRDVDADTTTLVNRNADGSVPNDRDADYAEHPAVDASGTKVAFTTDSNAILDGDADDVRQVVLRDVAAGTSALVSRPGGGGPIAGRDAGGVEEPTSRTVSDDGRYVVFASNADVLSDADDDRVVNVFRRDLRTDETILVSRGAAGAGNGPSNEPSISADGTRVAFTTTAPNLTGAGAGATHVVVRDIAAGTTVVADRRSDGGANGNYATQPAISGDGTRVAFAAPAAGFLGGGDFTSKVFVRDLEAGTTTLASRADGAGGAVADGHAGQPALDGDGDRVAFMSSATNLDAQDTGQGNDVYVRDLVADDVELASGGSAAAVGTAKDAARPSLSADGTKVAFRAQTTGLAGVQAYVRTLGGALVRADVDAAGDGMDGSAGAPSLSADGTRVAYAFAPAAGGPGQAYVRDVAEATTTLVSRASGVDGAAADRDAAGVSLSGDGRCATFTSGATNLGPAYAGGDYAQLWLRALGGDCAGEPAPVVTITGGPAGEIETGAATFTFTSAAASPAFACRLDGADFAPCASPAAVTGVAPGAHRFAVRVTDVHGNVSAAAERAFSVKAPPSGGSAAGDSAPAGGSGPAARNATPAPGGAPARTAAGQARGGRPVLAFTAATVKRLARGKALAVTVRCTAKARCAGTLTVALGKRRLARVKLSVAPGRTVTVRVPVRRAVRSGARLTLSATLAGRVVATTTARAK